MPVWYVTYGSNLHRARFDCYIAGGRPPGAARTYPGARDPRPPRDDAAVWLDGGIYFAGHSPVWENGGRAFYDARLPGQVAARAYLVSEQQLADVVDQEMYRDPGTTDVDVAEVAAAGRLTIGSGRYETLVHAGELRGHPLITFTAPWHLADVTPTRPSGVYLRMLGLGLCETHGWSSQTAANYLTGLPGADTWAPADVAALLTAHPS